MVSFPIQVNLCVCACRYIILGVICFASPISLNIILSPWFDTSLIINNKYLLISLYSSFLGGANGKEPACQCRKHKRHGFNPWVGKISWRRKWQPTPVFLPGESHEQRSLAGYSLWYHKESDMTEYTQTVILVTKPPPPPQEHHDLTMTWPQEQRLWPQK